MADIKINLPSNDAEMAKFADELLQGMNARLQENAAKAEHVLVVVQVWKLTGADLAEQFDAEAIDSEIADAIIGALEPDATARAVSVYAPGVVKVDALARGLALQQK